MKTVQIGINKSNKIFCFAVNPLIKHHGLFWLFVNDMIEKLKMELKDLNNTMKDDDDNISLILCW